MYSDYNPQYIQVNKQTPSWAVVRPRRRQERLMHLCAGSGVVVSLTPVSSVPLALDGVPCAQSSVVKIQNHDLTLYILTRSETMALRAARR